MISLFDPFDIPTNRFNHAGRFMPHDHGQLNMEFPEHLVEVRVTKSRV
jgi:hypothetical protein